MVDKVRRTPYRDNVPLRAHTQVNIAGVQSPDTDTSIFLTNMRQYSQTAATEAADVGRDLSTNYKNFAVHSGTTNARDIVVQLRVGGSAWVNIPTDFMSNGSATITPGELVFITLPMTGVAVRFVVDQPLVATDFAVSIAASGTDINVNR